MGRELDVRVARALGQEKPPTLDDRRYDWGDPFEGWWQGIYWIDDRSFQEVEWPPRYSTNIAAAWELDGEGWMWEFEEIITPARSYLDVIVYTERGWFGAEVLFADHPTKAEAYATGRCLAWLKAKEADSDRDE